MRRRDIWTQCLENYEKKAMCPCGVVLFWRLGEGDATRHAANVCGGCAGRLSPHCHSLMQYQRYSIIGNGNMGCRNAQDDSLLFQRRSKWQKKMSAGLSISLVTCPICIETLPVRRKVITDMFQRKRQRISSFCCKVSRHVALRSNINRCA